jgi:tetratricopeptide (TPR) repeat protein
MPVRHTTHQLEDASRRAFDRLLPLQWVVRPKQPDYGVDLEVEIFEEGGESTGLLFYVQLRATDSEPSTITLKLELDQIRYFQSLDIPTLIVRYGRKKDEFHGKWHFLINPSLAEQDQQTMTLHLKDVERLSAETIPAIGHTVAARRNLRKHSSSSPMAIKLDASELETQNRFTIEQALEKLLGEVRCLKPQESGEDIYIEVTAKHAECRIGVDLLGSLTFKLQTYEAEEIELKFAYGLAALLGQLGLPSHAEAMARYTLKIGKPSYSQFVALDACRALANYPAAMVELAILNKLHENQQVEYAELCAMLMTSHADPETSRAAAEQLYFAAADAARAGGNTQGEAAAYYSLGNMARAESQFLQSISFYNRARKTWIAYGDRVYFRQELAGSLYLARRYKLAARLYKSAIIVGEDHISDMRLGDALLMAGFAASAHEAFSSAKTNAGESWREQTAEVYVWLSARIADRFGDDVPVQRKAASDCLKMLSEADDNYLGRLQEIVTSVDAYCEVANFNLGTAAANLGEPELALQCYLICATRLTIDGESWSNAMKCAWNMGRAMTLNVMAAALRLGGPDTYTRFRVDMAAQFNSAELVDALDEMARTLKPRWENDGFLLRAHTDDGMFTVVLK